MSADEPDLLDLIEEAEHGPPACPHAVMMKTGGFVQEWDEDSPYYAEWVHAHPNCRRSKFPGCKQPMPTVKWDKELQKDVPI